MIKKPDHISQEDWDDVDSPELTAEDFARMRPAKEVLPPAFYQALVEGRVGRPKAENPKEKVSIRLDADVVEWLRAGGKGWQTRANEILAEKMAAEERT